MRGELIRERLHRGQRVYGTHVCSLGNPLAARMTADCELDFVFICNEHMPIDRTETAMMCQIPTEYEDPKFVELVEDVIRRSRAAGVGVGLHRQMTHLKGEHLKRFLDAGMNWIANGADVVAMRDEMNRQLRDLRQLCGDTYARQGPPGTKASPCIG